MGENVSRSCNMTNCGGRCGICTPDTPERREEAKLSFEDRALAVRLEDAVHNGDIAPLYALLARLRAAFARAERYRGALEYYANPDNWRKDDWGIKAIGAEYGESGNIARRALGQEGA